MMSAQTITPSMKRGSPTGFEVRIRFIVMPFLVMWLGCSCDVREEVRPRFFLGSRAAEPLLVMRRGEARIIAGGKALIVQLCAEVEGVDGGGHVTWVLR